MDGIMIDDRISNLHEALRRKDFEYVRRLLPHDTILQDVPLEIFDSFPTFPHQRNTEERGKKWVKDAKTSLRSLQFLPAHREVIVVLWPGAATVCDGHCRRYLWQRGLLELPPGRVVNIVVKHAASEDDAVAIYETYDNRAAVETSRDIADGEARKFGQTLDSTFLRGGNKQALRNAYAILTGNIDAAQDRGQSMRDGDLPNERALRSLFLPVLFRLDRIKPTSRNFNGQILTAAIITTVVDGPEEAVDGFFSAFLDETHHIQNEGGKNAVAHLAKMRSDPKGDFYHYSGSAEYENIQRVIWLYEEHRFRRAHNLSRVFRLPVRGKPETRFVGPFKTHRKVDFRHFVIANDLAGLRGLISQRVPS